MVEAGLKLQEKLAAKLDDFARELLLTQAERACDLFLSLLRREGELQKEGGRILQGAALAPAISTIAQIVNDATMMQVVVAVDERVLVSVPRDKTLTILPPNIATTCYVRGDAFRGDIAFNTPLYGAARLVSESAKVCVVIGAETSRINETIIGLSAIQRDIIDLAEGLQDERSEAVADFVKAIRRIAKRIHLLALNASILSAQAGEHGRGFAVVAGEIGELAEKTRQSTTDLEQEFLGKKSQIMTERRSGGRRGR